MAPAIPVRRKKLVFSLVPDEFLEVAPQSGFGEIETA
jgi:hypothetical protein